MGLSRRRRGVDEIMVVESMYDLSSSHDEWLSTVSRSINANLGAERGALVVQYQRRAARFLDVRPLFVDTPPGTEDGFPHIITPIVDNREIIALLAREPLSGLLETFPAGHPYRELCRKHLEPIRTVDTNCFAAFDTPAHLVTISPMFAREATPGPATRARYRRLAAHFSAAQRLRRRFGARPNASADAVFDPGGRERDATGSARERTVLDALRLAVLAREAARSGLRRRDVDQALGMWTALASGRWSLVDRFESDGRRFVIALSNENAPGDPRALTPREEQIAQLAGFGAPNAEIAYALGITAECVSAHLHAALRKLRCKNRGDLIRMMSSGAYEFTMEVHGDLIGVIVEPPASTRWFDALTPAEREVLAAIRAGRSNAEIAQARGTSARTVANQVASILSKTGMSSRYELMAG